MVLLEPALVERDDFVAIVRIALAVDAAQVRFHGGLTDEQGVLDVFESTSD